MRWATLVLLTLLGCNDLREFRGDWQGQRVGVAAALREGFGEPELSMTLSIDSVSEHGLAARLAIAGRLPETPITSVPGADADALSGLTFAGGPLRVYLAFVSIPDGGGEALVVVALFDDRRIEVRVLRGGDQALYGIFALTESPP